MRLQSADSAICAVCVLFNTTFTDPGGYFNMRLLKKTGPIIVIWTFCLALSVPMLAFAKEVDTSIAACLKGWRDHPFGNDPQFKTLGSSVKVFGIGTATGDSEPTSSSSLVLVSPIFSAMGGSTVKLLNPNGWYCLQTTGSILGRLTLRVHCKARLAMTSDGKTVLGDNRENTGIRDIVVTSMGSVSIERPCD